MPRIEVVIDQDNVISHCIDRDVRAKKQVDVYSQEAFLEYELKSHTEIARVLYFNPEIH